MNKKETQRRFIFVCLAPTVILVILFMMIPTFDVFCYSLCGKTGIVGDAPFVGLNNSKTLLTDPRFIESVQNMILIIVIVTLFTAVPAVPFATLLIREEFKGKNFFRVISYIPNILSIVVIVGIFSTIYAPDNGLLNSLLEMIGLSTLQKQRMGDSGIILYSIIFALVRQVISYYIAVYMASMSSIPEDLYEAAALEGAGKVKQFFMITLPLIQNNIRMTLAFFVISMIDLSFMFIQINTNGDLGSEILPNYMYNKVFGGNYSYGMAIGIITSISSFALSGLLNKIIERDVLEFQEV